MRNFLILFLFVWSFNLNAKSYGCSLAVYNKLDIPVTISFYKLSHQNEQYGPRQLVEIPANDIYTLSFTNVSSYNWQVITPVSKVLIYKGVALTSCISEGGELVIRPRSI
jgi:hypothetical protein